MKNKDITISFDVTTRSGKVVHVCVPPVVREVSERTPVRTGLRAGDVIRTSTVQEQQSHALLRSMTDNQEPNSEPMPVFSRSFLHGSQRFDAAKLAAQRAAETADKSSSKTTDE